jgi:beta-N-acetylhexosaminidase
MKRSAPVHFIAVFPAFLLLLFFLPTSCDVFSGEKNMAAARRERALKEVAPLVRSMSVEEKSAQVLMASIDGKERFAPYLRTHFEGIVPGSILLFKYNVADSPRAVFGFLSSCDTAFASLGAKVPVMYAIDDEGGDVFRTANLTTRLPSAEFIAANATPEEARSLYESLGKQLALMGINMNLAPVAEVSTPVNTDFLRTRSYSKSTDTVVAFSSAAIYGFESGGIASAMKHFPGTGKADPHEGVSLLDVSRDEFLSTYIESFSRLVSVKPAAVLVSHCIVSAIESDVPFCLSEKGVTGLLRKKLKYHGLVITDDVAMKALSREGYSPGKAAVLALRAGCDMVMISDRNIRPVCESIASAARDDPEFAGRLDEAVSRILAVKGGLGLVKTTQERYSDTSMRSPSAGDSPSFDEAAFIDERKRGDAILEAIHGR